MSKMSNEEQLLKLAYKEILTLKPKKKNLPLADLIEEVDNELIPNLILVEKNYPGSSIMMITGMPILRIKRTDDVPKIKKTSGKKVRRK